MITAPNVGAVEHELVFFRTNMDPAKLPTEADGSVDEEKMDEVAEEGGEIADVEAGEFEIGNVRPQARQVRDVLQPSGSLRPGHVRDAERQQVALGGRAFAHAG